MNIKCFVLFRHFIFVLAILIFHSQLACLAASDGLVLGVQTTINSSYIKNDAASSDVINFKEEGKMEEIHSSFEDTSTTREEVKKVDIFKSEPTLNFQHQHVNIATELSESGQAAMVYTLVDSDPQTSATDLSAEPNSTGPVTITLSLSDARAPVHVNNTDAEYGLQESEDAVELAPDLSEEKNDTAPVSAPDLSPPAQEDIPSFSEWAQKQLAEAEKKNGENVTGSGGMPAAPLKARHNKNYASPDCGAKVVGANPEAVSAGSVLSSSRDEYLLNTCNARTWFIVELCEAIQPRKVEIANFELFSSSPHELSVWLSDRYPTRDWAPAGRFSAQDERTLQAFNLSHTSHFGKYVKVEVHSHYGHEHYCPVSLFRVYGTSEIEVLDTVDEGIHPHAADDDDDDPPVGEGGEAPKNLFGSARDAVLSIVKKAAEALAKSPEGGRDNSSVPVTNHGADPGRPQLCVTPAHIAVCVNCSDDFYDRMYYQMSCRSQMLAGLLSSSFVRQSVTSSEFCAARGLDLRVGAPYPARPHPGPQPRPIDYLQSLLPSETIAALCNLLAAAQRKVVLNGSTEQTPIDNGTVSGDVPPSPDAPTPALPDVSGSCAADGNASEDGTVATQPPYETLTIRPSRTMPHDLHNTSHTAANVTTRVDNTVSVSPVGPPDNSTEAEVADSLSLVVEEAVDAGSLDSLFSELEQAVVPSPRVPPAPQKESVFVRLANRIKALERNMSLSGQYLEELSRRYKRQVEEMQRALATAIEDRRRGEEREGLRLEQMTQLTQQVETLTLAVKDLLEERDSWHHKATVMGQHGVIVVVEVLVFALVLYVCRWLPEVEVARRKFSVAWPRAKNVTRRVSVDQALPHNLPKRRRPSDEACIIAAGNARKELLYQDGRRKVSKGESRRQRRKRKRELIAQQSVDVEVRPSPSLLDNNCTESVSAWWEEEGAPPAPPPPPPPVVVATPDYVQTAVAQRQERLARTSSENSDRDAKTVLPVKKTGPFKKIVKKFF